MNKRTLAVRELELTPEQQKERDIQRLAMHLRAQFRRLNNKKRPYAADQDSDPLAQTQESAEDALVAAISNVDISNKRSATQ